MANSQLRADLRRDGKIVIGSAEGDYFNTQHTLDEKEAVGFAAHLLKIALASQREPLSPTEQQSDTVFDVQPRAISLADTESGKRMNVVLWFGKSGIAFPIEYAMAEQLFGVVMAASAKGAKH